VDYSNGFLFHAGSSSRPQRSLPARRTNQPQSTKHQRPRVPSRQCGTQFRGIPTKVGPYRHLVKTWIILMGFCSMQAHLRDHNDLYQPEEPINHNLQKNQRPRVPSRQCGTQFFSPLRGSQQGRSLPTASQNLDYSNGFSFYAGSSSRPQRSLPARRTNQPQSTKNQRPRVPSRQCGTQLLSPLRGSQQGWSLPTASQNVDYSNTFGSMQAHLRDHNDLYQYQDPMNHNLQKTTGHGFPAVNVELSSSPHYGDAKKR
jgi:hypothetical protein